MFPRVAYIVLHENETLVKLYLLRSLLAGTDEIRFFVSHENKINNNIFEGTFVQLYAYTSSLNAIYGRNRFFFCFVEYYIISTMYTYW